METELRPFFIDLELHEDDRGSVHGIMDNLPARGIKRVYCVENFSRGQIRAWHGHRVGETYIYCASGAVKLGGLLLDNHNDVVVGTLSARQPRLFYVPKGWANGAMSLTDGTKLIVMSTLTLSEVRGDDIRLPWDVVGKEIWDVKHR